MKLGLIVHPERPRAIEVAAEIVRLWSGRGLPLVARAQDADRLGVEAGDLTAGVDVLVAVGGDGTVLEAVATALHADLPVLGVNVGRLGFLAEVEPERLEEALEVLAHGEWEESPRMTVQVTWEGGGTEVGLNDVVVEKDFSPRAVSLSVSVDGRHFMAYHADGLVVATPTGSTAYSLSAGGPLLDPELEALLLTAVAPHSLLDRSVVFPATAGLRITVTDGRPAGLHVDGRPVARLQPGQWVEVTRGPRDARFVRLTDRALPEVIATKFRMGDA